MQIGNHDEEIRSLLVLRRRYDFGPKPYTGLDTIVVVCALFQLYVPTLVRWGRGRFRCCRRPMAVEVWMTSEQAHWGLCAGHGSALLRHFDAAGIDRTHPWKVDDAVRAFHGLPPSEAEERRESLAACARLDALAVELGLPPRHSSPQHTGTLH